MARNSLHRSSLLLRSLVSEKLFPSFNPSSLSDFSFKTLTIPQLSTLIPPVLLFQLNPFSSLTTSCNPLYNSHPIFSQSRSFSSSNSSSNFVVVKSEEEFSNSLKKVQDENLPAIFYFTAAWCGPCKLMSPVIEDLSKKYPSVTTYKIDIDMEEIQSKLSDLQIYSVPTLHFFQDGKKATEIVGADVARLKQTVENLYK